MGMASCSGQPVATPPSAAGADPHGVWQGPARPCHTLPPECVANSRDVRTSPSCRVPAGGHTVSVLLADVVVTSDAVASTRARSAKIAAIADLLGRLTPGEIDAAVGFLTGEPRQGRVGVGGATLFGLDVTPADVPT